MAGTTYLKDTFNRWMVETLKTTCEQRTGTVRRLAELYRRASGRTDCTERAAIRLRVSGPAASGVGEACGDAWGGQPSGGESVVSAGMTGAVVRPITKSPAATFPLTTSRRSASLEG